VNGILPEDELAIPTLTTLWTRVRKRLEENGLEFGVSPIVLKDVAPAEMAAICGLLGRRAPSGSVISIDLALLDEVLRTGAVGQGLSEVLTGLGGPLIDRRTRRREREFAKQQLWEQAADHPGASDPRVRDWLAQLRRTGRLTRLDVPNPAPVLLEALDLVVALLGSLGADFRAPAGALAVLAARRFGDAHALDDENPVGALTLDALRVVTGHVDRKSAWAAVGVEVDSVSSSALALNLAPGR
jgi:uncharacterized protein (TIGR02679 family)